jgi:putative Mg2+ transporter-C (MgtC) family protein
MEFGIIFLRFAVVFVLTFIYGLQRQRSHKPVGFGTFTLVAIGACGLAITASEIGFVNSIGLLSAIITGIGFLGAGALIRSPDKIFGFTTAASIWLFAIFGLIIGIGDYRNGLIIYSLVWLVIIFDRHLEKRGIGSYRKKIVIHSSRFDNKKEITKLLAKHCTRFSLISVNIDKPEKKAVLSYLIEGPRGDIEYLLKDFYREKWVDAVFFE